MPVVLRRARTASRQMEALGVTVVHRPFELHPEIPPGGRTIRPDGRLAPTFDRIAAECDGDRPAVRGARRACRTRRRALETAEWVRAAPPRRVRPRCTRRSSTPTSPPALAIDDPDVARLARRPRPARRPPRCAPRSTAGAAAAARRRLDGRGARGRGVVHAHLGAGRRLRGAGRARSRDARALGHQAGGPLRASSSGSADR